MANILQLLIILVVMHLHVEFISSWVHLLVVCHYLVDFSVVKDLVSKQVQSLLFYFLLQYFCYKHVELVILSCSHR